MTYLHFQSRTLVMALGVLLKIGCLELSAYVLPSEEIIEMSETNNIVVLWTVYDNSYTNSYIRSTTWDSVNGWSRNVTLSADPGYSFKPVLAINNAGNGAALWTTLDVNGIYTLQGSIYYNGVWAPPVMLSEAKETVIDYRIKVNSNGDLSATWSSYLSNSTDTEIYGLSASNVATGWNTTTGITVISD